MKSCQCSAHFKSNKLKHFVDKEAIWSIRMHKMSVGCMAYLNVHVGLEKGKMCLEIGRLSRYVTREM